MSDIDISNFVNDYLDGDKKNKTHEAWWNESDNNYLSSESLQKCYDYFINKYSEEDEITYFKWNVEGYYVGSEIAGKRADLLIIDDMED